MKTPVPSAVAFAILAIAVVSPTLPTRAEDTSASEPRATLVDPTAPEARSYRSAGEYAIDRLVMTMITDSSRAVANGKEVDALATFHLKDVPKKNGTVAGLPRITALKFTSLKLRNPDNAPDFADSAALQEVKTQLAGGVPPRILVQRIERPGGASEWRVYKPLANIRQCGSCHGSMDEMSPELREAIQKKYPKDEANGYRVGEWRGLIRVTVADEPKALPAPKK
jgi:hypothetical protein